MNNQPTMSQCKEYKKVLFTCQKCGFNTKIAKNINEHVKSCTLEYKVYDILSLENKIKTLESENKKMTNLLVIERCKVSILSDLLKNNSNIDISD